MKNNTDCSLSFSRLFIFYWAMFWLMNGLDKFLNGKQVLFFTWYGKNRDMQFGDYFMKISVPESWLQPLLYLTGVWEILIFIPLAITLFEHVRYSKLDVQWFKISMFWGGATFVAFAFFDIIFGDRAELLEHSTFLILTGVTYHLVLTYSPRTIRE